MPISRYLKFTIGSKQVQVSDPTQLPISIDYALEDPDNFQAKPSAQALAVTVPATLLNDIAGNTFRNPDIADFTDGQLFKNSQPFLIDENGFEILKGTAFLTKATHNVVPVSYSYNLFGDNAEWQIPLSLNTLYDFLKQLNFTFSIDNIVASWAFDGTDPTLPYVFAPVRYRDAMGGYTINTINNVPVSVPVDDNYLPETMKPSISKYFILYWAFKSVGYKIQSAFMDSEYFRRQVMPWSWGSFLDSDSTLLTIHNFLAKSTGDQYYSFDKKESFVWDLKVSNDSTDGAYDNNHNYNYNATTKAMEWTYAAPDNGILDATFLLQIQYDARLNGAQSNINCQVNWYKNGTSVGTSPITKLGGVIALGKEDIDIKKIYFDQPVQLGDVISATITVGGHSSLLGFASITANVLGFDLEYFRIPLGGSINFLNYTGFQNINFMDYFAGLIDEFNLSIGTDPVNKIVVIEPTHSWSKDNNPSVTTSGYFKNDYVDWNTKEDLSKDWEMDNYSDYNNQLTFNYKNDSNDGILKLVQDRLGLLILNPLDIPILAAAQYIFPNRFTVGKKAIENRFFAPTMHYNLDQWKALGTGSNAGISPQMVCMIPENVSNTSSDSSQNTFLPKSCYYKGNITGAGAWQFNGTAYQNYPFMFAVNYQPGGENDPILSYSDENISGVIGKGLLKRFYWQRLAIMRNGQWYNTFFRLRNVDVIDSMHREYKSFKGQKWELIQITGYKPLTEDSTAVLLRKWAPVTQADFDNTFPSTTNILGGALTSTYDLKYQALKCLISDIPNQYVPT